MTTTELTPGHGITVTTYHGARDGIPVVQIDTAEDTGRLRVNLWTPPRFAFALETEPIDLHTVRALMAKTARAAVASLA